MDTDAKNVVRFASCFYGGGWQSIHEAYASTVAEIWTLTLTKNPIENHLKFRPLKILMIMSAAHILIPIGISVELLRWRDGHALRQIWNWNKFDIWMEYRMKKVKKVQNNNFYSNKKAI
jgi:hypothetical protein